MRIKILLPVFNDWKALKILLGLIENIYKDSEYKFSYLAINDSSSETYNKEDFEGFDLKVIHLNCNVGHQRAIALGISYLVDHSDFEKLIVMDSDGEDMPEHIEKLIEKSKIEPDKIIFASRKKRSEGYLFRLFYLLYKTVFKSLTGHVITFGNFSLVPVSKIKKLAFVSDIWNNYPGGVIRSKIPFDSISLNRGTRLEGNSKMNFQSLILHGMSAIAVFLDLTAVRILFFVALMIAFSILGIGIVVYLKFGMQQATPGWASNLIMSFLMLFLQGFIISLFILFMNLSFRRFTSFIPYLGYKNYIDYVE